MRFGGNHSTDSDRSTASSRSDEVRRRRAQRSQQRVSTVNSRVVNPINPRPVIVRGGSFGTPIHSKAGTRARRQFYLTMDRTAGTELRLPAIPLLNPGWRLFSGLIFILATVGAFSLYTSPFFAINHVDVKGVERLSPDEINQTLGLDNLSIIEVDAQDIHTQVTRAFPELINVRVSIELPNVVTITAAERKPVMAVAKGDQLSWIDADGIIFPARGDAGPLATIHTDDDLPLAPVAVDASSALATPTAPDTQKASAKKDETKILVTGPSKVDPALLSAAQGLYEKLPPDTQMIYSRQDGMGWIDPQGWQVYIGTDLSNFSEKYEMYQKIVAYLTEQGQRPTMVSVEQLNAPFYRLEQDNNGG